jgi:hypothetical protein
MWLAYPLICIEVKAFTQHVVGFLEPIHQPFDFVEVECFLFLRILSVN